MEEIILAAITVAAVLGVVTLLALISWDLRDDDYSSMDRRLARRAARRAGRSTRGASVP